MILSSKTCLLSLTTKIYNFLGSIVLTLLFDMPTGKTYAAKDVVEGIEYEFRVSAINISGSGEPSTPSEFVIARDPKSE